MSDKAEPLVWTTKTRKLADLLRWDPNPRHLTEEQAQRLYESISEFGYSQLYEVEPDGTIIDGHQRNEIMLRMAEYGPDVEIEVREASRKLTLQERKDYIMLKHKAAVGDWDWDALANLYDPEELVDQWGFSEGSLFPAERDYRTEEIDLDNLPDYPVWCLITIPMEVLPEVKSSIDELEKHGVTVEYSNR